MKYTHGKSNTRIYRIWKNMKQRCSNPKASHYKYYGEKWENFIDFYNWSIKNGYKENLTIDRIDSNKNYEPNNCRWCSYKEQNGHLPNLRKIK